MTPHFSDAEIACKHCGEVPRHQTFLAFMRQLEKLRVVLGFPFVVTSGYRCADHPVEQRKINDEKGPLGFRNIISAHSHGAVDIRVNRKQAGELVTYAVVGGFTGIGMRQHGPDGGRIVHLDMIRRFDDETPCFWTYDAEGPREL